MKANLYSVQLDFDQILDLVKRLPNKEKLRLSRELEKAEIDTKLSDLLKAFKTNELDPETIDKEVEAVRQELHADAIY